MENHELNETLKRLEPKSKKCEYCGFGTVSNINDCYYGSVFKEKARTNIIVHRSVKFAQMDIGIPRCSACKEKHGEISTKSKLVGFAAIGVLLLLGYLIVPISAPAVVVFIVASAFTWVFASDKFEEKQFEQIGILKEHAGFEKDETVRTFLAIGWSMSPPSA